MDVALNLSPYQLSKIIDLDDGDYIDMEAVQHIIDSINKSYLVNNVSLIQRYCTEELNYIKPGKFYEKLSDEQKDEWQLRYDDIRIDFQRFCEVNRIYYSNEIYAKSIVEYLVDKLNLETNELKDVLRFRIYGIKLKNS